MLDGIDEVRNYIKLIYNKVLTMMIVPVLLFIAMLFVNWQCALILLIMYPLIVLFMIILGHAAQDKAIKQFGNFQILSNNFIDSLRGIDTLKYLGLSKRYSTSIFHLSKNFRRKTMAVLRVAMLSTFALDFFTTLSIAVIAVYLGFDLLNGKITLFPALAILILAPEYFLPIRNFAGFFTTLSIAVIAVYLGFDLLNGKITLFPALAILILAPEYFLPIRNFAGDFHATLNGKNAFHRINELIKAPKEPVEELQLSQWSQDDQLTIKDMNFKYEKGSKIGPISLNIHGYEKVGVIGMSGSGKSALINLLSGFLTPKNGEITIQKQDAKTLNIPNWHKQLIYIPQNPYVFTASLRDNVAFYTPGASDDEIRQAIHVVGLDDLVKELPDGLDTIIGQGKRVLSGGQAQRIALARAFLDQQRKVMIFDEPTAHLDIETEVDLKKKCCH